MKHILALASFALFVMAFACSAGTGGRAINIEIALSGTDEPSFVNALGWSVELSEASVTLGPVYVFAPANAPTAALLPLFGSGIGPNRAFAHGGLDPLDGRAVRGELLEQILVDALDPTPIVRAAPGEEGPVDEVAVELLPTATGASARVSGVAIRDGETVEFSGELTLNEEEFRRVEGIALQAFLLEGSRVSVRVDPRSWLSGVAFDRLDGQPLEGASQPQAAFRIGLRSARSFSAEHSNDTE
ncbi:MAG: hypothetical protein ACI9KE_001187 [Polyangiales bacterium]|jgi:hypothetical protein